MKWVFVWLALCLATQVWLCFRVARSSVPLAIVTFFLGPLGAVYTVFKHRGDEETSATLPFALNLVFTMLLVGAAWQAASSMTEEEQGDVAEQGQQQVAESEGTSPAMLSSGGSGDSAVTGGGGGDSEPEAAAPTASGDPWAVLSSALQVAHVKHAITHLPVDAKLPEGIADAAHITLSGPDATAPALAVAAASAASPAANAASAVELTALVLRCEQDQACRSVAAGYMQQASANRPRVLQNKQMLMVLPPGEFDDAFGSGSVLVSAFRRM